MLLLLNKKLLAWVFLAIISVTFMAIPATAVLAVHDINQPETTWTDAGCAHAFQEETDDPEAYDRCNAGNTDKTQGEEFISCEERAGGEFSYILCPLLGGLNNGVQWLDGKINELLFLDSAYYNNPEIREVWARFRNIALALLVPIILVMVIGTALDFKFVDAYTARRAAPRFFAAVIFIVLSFDICRLMIEITNGLAQGVVGIIAQPFGGNGMTGVEALSLENIFTPVIGPNQGTAIFAVGIMAGIGAFALGAVTIPILASFLFVLCIAMIMVFFVLVFRQVLLVFLVVVSPIAILAWIFPGNDKPWKIWWASFSKLLLLYMVILGIMITGRAFASILNDTGVDGVTGLLIKVAAVVGSIALIPKMFTFAGGAFANIAGMANDRSRGLFDRQRKYRADNRKSTMARAREGNRFKRKNAFTSKLNTAAGMAYQAKNGISLSKNPLSKVQAGFDIEKEKAAHEFSEKNPFFNYFAEDDNVLGAAFESKGKKDFMEKLKDTEDARFVTVTKDANGNVLSSSVSDVQQATMERAWGYVGQAKKQGGEEQFNRAALQRLSKDGTYFKDAAHLASAITSVYGDDRQGAGSAFMAAAGTSLNAGRGDIGAAGAGAKLGLLQQQYDLDEGKSTFVDRNKNVQALTAENIQRNYVHQVLDSQPASTLVHPQMKAKYVEDNIIPVMRDRIQDSRNNMNAVMDDSTSTETQKTEAKRAYMRELAQADNIHQAILGSSPQLGKLFGEQVIDMELGTVQQPAQEVPTGLYNADGVTPIMRTEPAKTKRVTTRTEVQGHKEDEDYQIYHKEFISAEDAERQRRAAAAGTAQALEQARLGNTPIGGGPIGGTPLGG